MATRSFGERILRNEDERLLRGRGMYLDDIAMPGVLHAASMGSPNPVVRGTVSATGRIEHTFGKVVAWAGATRRSRGASSSNG